MLNIYKFHFFITSEIFVDRLYSKLQKTEAVFHNRLLLPTIAIDNSLFFTYHDNFYIFYHYHMDKGHSGRYYVFERMNGAFSFSDLGNLRQLVYFLQLLHAVNFR